MTRWMIGLALGLAGCRAGADAATPTDEHARGPGHGHHGHGHEQEHEPHGHAEAGGHGGHAMQHRFENAEAWAKEFDSPERAAWQKPDEVVAALSLSKDTKVADIGAGTGYFSVRLAAAVPGGKVFASDIEPDMVRYLGERATKDGLANLVAVQGKPSDPALPEPVDVVFLCNVYHHIADRTAYFSGVRAKLESGGRLVLVDFKKDAPADIPGPPPQHRIAQAQAVEELASAGFELANADRELLPYQYVLVFRATQ